MVARGKGDLVGGGGVVAGVVGAGACLGRVRLVMFVLHRVGVR